MKTNSQVAMSVATRNLKQYTHDLEVAIVVLVQDIETQQALRLKLAKVQGVLNFMEKEVDNDQ